MNRAEAIANEWLLGEGFDQIKYEPFGPDTFPDFQLGEDTIAEVTWLLQVDGDTQKPLSESEAPFLKGFERALKAMGPDPAGLSHFVDVSYRKPLFSNFKDLNRALNEALSGDIQSFGNRVRIYLKPNIWIEIYPASKDYGQSFILGCSANYDAGGWVREFVPNSLNATVARKEALAERQKLSTQFRHRMLLMIDGMGGARDDYKDCKVKLDFYTEAVVLGFHGELGRWPREVD